MPTLQLVTTEVNFGRCFLKYPYEKTIQLVNHDVLPGCYKVLPQVSSFLFLHAELYSGGLPQREGGIF